MSYCVNCGVELDRTAESCPLCHTPVLNPQELVDRQGPRPFPTEKGEVPLPAKWELALLISAMLASVSVCCGVLNLFLRTGHIWSLYVIGAAVMLWIFLVPPLLRRGLSPVVQLLCDLGAVAVYLLAIAWNLKGLGWYVHLALPILGWLGCLILALMWQFRRRSVITSITLTIGAAGLFPVGVELACDLYFRQAYQPRWSLVVLTVAVALVIPLIVVRRVPSLREEARKRFHM